MSSKGFGKQKEGEPSAKKVSLKPTRSSSYKPLVGSFAKLLSKHCAIFESYKASGLVTTNDIYARLENDSTFWFIGKIINKKDSFDSNSILVIENVLVEYAKSLRPNELAGARAIRKNIEVQ